MIDFYDALLIFLDKGGVVLYPLFILTFILWVLLIDRYVYFYFYAKKFKQTLLKKFEEQKNRYGSYEIFIQNDLKKEYELKLFANQKLIQTLYMLAPLIGLLGTVLGMIHIFDIIAITGNSSAKSLSNGVAMATIPTLCGIVIVVSSIFFIKKYELKANKELVDLFEGNYEKRD